MLEKLERFCKASGYFIKLSNPMAKEPGREARAYVAGHLKRTGFKSVKPKVIMGEGNRTNLWRSEAQRALNRDLRNARRRRKAAERRAAREALVD